MMDGDFVLCEAATSSIDLRICRALLKFGADPCMANKMGSTARTHCCLSWTSGCGSVVDSPAANANHRDRHGHGPLTCAISRDHKDVATLLLANGADPRLQPEALGVAAWEGRLRFVKMLIANGWDVHSKSHQRRTPLQHARIRNHKTVIQALIDAGAG
jgi:ankyrin repeat protein